MYLKKNYVGFYKGPFWLLNWLYVQWMTRQVRIHYWHQNVKVLTKLYLNKTLELLFLYFAHYEILEFPNLCNYIISNMATNIFF